jgi:hypothetical protein
MFAEISNGAPRYPADPFGENPNFQIPSKWAGGTLNGRIYVQLAITPRPAFDPLTQKLVELAPLQVEGVWTQRWQVVAATAEDLQANAAALQAEYDAELEKHFDTTAQARRYRDRITCSLRAGYPGPFQAEGLAFAQWMDECNAFGYQLLGAVLAGNEPLPTKEAFIAALPAINWPA